LPVHALRKILPLNMFSFARVSSEPGSYGLQHLSKFRGLVKKNHYREKDNYYLRDMRFVVLDTETTGFKPLEGDEIISVGACVVMGDRILPERFHKLVNPRRPVPPVVTELTGITDAVLEKADGFSQVAAELMEFLQDSIIVGHSIKFDISFLNYKLKPYGVSINNYYLDTGVLSKILNTGLRSHSLDSILQHMSIEPAGRHTALGDALLTAGVFLRFLDRLQELKIWTLWDLRSFIRHSMLYII